MGKRIGELLGVIGREQLKNNIGAFGDQEAMARVALSRGSDAERALKEWNRQPPILEQEEEKSVMALVKYINTMSRTAGKSGVGKKQGWIIGKTAEGMTFNISRKNPMLIEISSINLETPSREYITTINPEEAYSIAKVRYSSEFGSAKSYPNVPLQVQREVEIHLPEEDIQDCIGVKKNEFTREKCHNDPEEIEAAIGEMVAHLQAAMSGYKVEANGQAIIREEIDPQESLRKIRLRENGSAYTGVSTLGNTELDSEELERYGKYMEEARAAHENAQRLYDLIMKAYERILSFGIHHDIGVNLFKCYITAKGKTQAEILRIIKERAVGTELVEKTREHVESQMQLTEEKTEEIK